MIKPLITEHHMKPCKMCADDASKYNHCAFCGLTFETMDELVYHLDDCPEDPFN